MLFIEISVHEVPGTVIARLEFRTFGGRRSTFSVSFVTNPWISLHSEPLKSARENVVGGRFGLRLQILDVGSLCNFCIIESVVSALLLTGKQHLPRFLCILMSIWTLLHLSEIFDTACSYSHYISRDVLGFTYRFSLVIFIFCTYVCLHLSFFLWKSFTVWTDTRYGRCASPLNWWLGASKVTTKLFWKPSLQRAQRRMMNTDTVIRWYGRLRYHQFVRLQQRIARARSECDNIPTPRRGNIRGETAVSLPYATQSIPSPYPVCVSRPRGCAHLRCSYRSPMRDIWTRVRSLSFTCPHCGRGVTNL